MTVADISGNFTVINEGDFSREITSVFCGDLLSIVMSKAPADCAWVTVMGSVNSAAVASLADMSVIVLAHGTKIDDVALIKAQTQGINVLMSDLPVFEAAKLVHGKIPSC